MEDTAMLSALGERYILGSVGVVESEQLAILCVER
jgi:hypothetical protein